MQLPHNLDIVNIEDIVVIIKANKVEAFSNDYYASTPTKSARKSSLLNNSTSRSKSKSKSKLQPLKF